MCHLTELTTAHGTGIDQLLNACSGIVGADAVDGTRLASHKQVF